MQSTPQPGYDVAIIGGGVCGCSLLYALARYRLRCVLLEKENDVGVATTKANSAILHAGYDPAPGTRMARYNVRGNALAKEICQKLDILMEECGSLVLGFDEADRAEIDRLYRQGIENGVPDLRVVERDELHRMEPQLAPEARFALYAPSAAIVNPWELAFAQAEVAVQNGADVLLNSEVRGLAATGAPGTPGAFTLTTPRHTLSARYVVNAAGIHAAQVAALAGSVDFSIHTSRGQYFLLDKNQHALAKHVLFQCPTPLGKGVLVAPTVHGNLIVGPNAEPASCCDTTADGLAYVRASAVRSVPGIDFSQNIRNFAGLRAQAEVDDFIVGESPSVPGLFLAAGIKSPGLTSAVAIAEDLVRMLADAGLALHEKPDFTEERSILRFAHLNAEQQAEAIRQNPLYGRIVCRCVTVTEGEVVDALRRPQPPTSLDAVKRRVGPGMGRCQGGFCGVRVMDIIARELKLPHAAIPQDRLGMDVVFGRTKQQNCAGGAQMADEGQEEPSSAQGILPSAPGQGTGASSPSGGPAKGGDGV